MIKVDYKVCDECATCVSVCPVDAIVLDEYIIVDDKKCLACGRCVGICPVAAVSETMSGGNRSNAGGEESRLAH